MNRQEAEALLPWHVAGTLSVEEAQAVQAFIDSGEIDAAEIHSLEEFATEIRRVDDDEPAYNPALLDNVMARLDEVPQESISLASNDAEAPAGFFERLLGSLQWSATPGAARWALGAQFAAITGLVVALVVNPGVSGDEVYETVAGPAPVAATLPALSVGFEEGVTEAELRALLTGFDLEIVGGPSTIGLYQIAPRAEGVDLAALAAKLEASTVVLFASPE
ncbi:MAG: hypothetical protein AAF648_12685 [Pseudomonadota bacterium]